MFVGATPTVAINIMQINLFEVHKIKDSHHLVALVEMVETRGWWRKRRITTEHLLHTVDDTGTKPSWCYENGKLLQINDDCEVRNLVKKYLRREEWKNADIESLT